MRTCSGDGRFLTFETEHLMNMGEKAVVAVLLYLFRRIEKRLDGSPTLVPLDEAWVYLRHPLFRERVRDWLKTLRKLNGAVLLATQNLSDIFNSPIRDVVLESCPTKVLLPNAEAANPASRQFYESIGSERARDLDGPEEHPEAAVLRRLADRPAADRAGPGGVALSFVGVIRTGGTPAVEGAIAKYGENWPADWLRIRGLEDWADYLDEQLALEGSFK